MTDTRGRQEPAAGDDEGLGGASVAAEAPGRTGSTRRGKARRAKKRGKR